MIKKLALILLLLYLNCPAQTDSMLININQAVEDLLDEPESETDDSGLYELIEYYLEHPVDINSAEIKELVKLPYLDQVSARLILSHRNEYGTYFSVNELYSIKALPEELVKKILPFLSAGEKQTKEKLTGNPEPLSVTLRNRIIKDLSQRKGFRNHLFEGTDLKSYNRLNMGYRDFLHAGILTEKDAGEKSYYDFISGFIHLSDIYGFKDIIIGDYNVRFGQGLALWNAYGISKGSDAVFSVKKSTAAIKPSASSAENNFFRGVSFNYEWEHVNITLFYSSNRVDASIDSVGKITSLTTDGFHRTASERLKHNSAIEKSIGGMVDYRLLPSVSSGILCYRINFDHPYIASKVYDITGDNLYYYSSYIDMIIDKFNIYGELSFSGRSKPAYLLGISISPISEFCYSMLIRNYPLNYISIHGKGFGERSGARGNEFGIYNGIRWRTSYWNH